MNNNNTVAIKHTIPGSSQEQVAEQNNTEENNNEIQLEDDNQTIQIHKILLILI